MKHKPAMYALLRLDGELRGKLITHRQQDEAIQADLKAISRHAGASAKKKGHGVWGAVAERLMVLGGNYSQHARIAYRHALSPCKLNIITIWQ